MSKNTQQPKTNLHRRDFLKTAGAATLGALAAGARLSHAQPGVEGPWLIVLTSVSDEIGGVCNIDPEDTH